jgi:hypothetical protein
LLARSNSGHLNKNLYPYKKHTYLSQSQTLKLWNKHCTHAPPHKKGEKRKKQTKIEEETERLAKKNFYFLKPYNH